METPQNGIVQSSKLIFIGDVHGQIDKVEKFISSQDDDSVFVFLGDLIHIKPYFNVEQYYSTVEVLNYFRDLEKRRKCKFVLGNQEIYILDCLLSERKRGINKEEVQNSINAIRELPIMEQIDLLHWIRMIPFSLQVQTERKLYKVAHAYYIEDPKDKREKDLCSFGKLTDWMKKRYLPFKVNKNEVIILGHYGKPFIRPELKIIDATLLNGIGIFYAKNSLFEVL